MMRLFKSSEQILKKNNEPGSSLQSPLISLDKDSKGVAVTKVKKAFLLHAEYFKKVTYEMALLILYNMAHFRSCLSLFVYSLLSNELISTLISLHSWKNNTKSKCWFSWNLD